jgi:octaprenyl-diphosphate synthase
MAATLLPDGHGAPVVPTPRLTAFGCLHYLISDKPPGPGQRATFARQSRMRTLEDIKQPVAADLDTFEGHFKQVMKSDKMLLDKITHYIIRRKGKQMRPMFVFLSASLCGNVNHNTHIAASMIELLHTATLVHDDVVDDAHMRRGFFSINALWKNKIAVLVGDYLLSRGLLVSVENNQFELLRITSRAVQEMSEGELLQQQKSRLLDITEAVYFDIITQKTASLIAACCEAGASSAGAAPEIREKMNRFGHLAGLAFQVKDDIFDYGDGSLIGKPAGIDIQERKMTLPLIYALREAPAAERKRALQTVRHYNTDAKRVRELVQWVHQRGGIQYAIEKMHEFRHQAVALLNEFSPSPARESLIGLVDYTIARQQ